jgi:hypothetical protein
MVRKECEKTNWFEHGRKIALSGRRVTGDEHVVQCTKAEANIDSVALDRGFKTGMETYCQPETIYQVGKRGEFFSAEMCDGEQPRLLKKKHDDGVQEYCRRSNGYTAGAIGTPYNGICPKDLEPGFLPEFNRGRKAYLNTQIANAESEIKDLDSEIGALNNDLAFAEGRVLQHRMMRTPQPIIYTNDPNASAQAQAAAQAQQSHALMEEQSLQNQVDSITYRRQEKLNKKSALQQKIRDYRTEITGLGG